MKTQAKDIQFVIGAEGKPTAVLVGIATWERIIETLEDAEDLALAKETLAVLDAASGNLEKAGFLPWNNIRAELEKMDDAEK